MTAVPYFNGPGSEREDQAEEIDRHCSIPEPSKAASPRHKSNQPPPPHNPEPNLVKYRFEGHRRSGCVLSSPSEMLSVGSKQLRKLSMFRRNPDRVADARKRTVQPLLFPCASFQVPRLLGYRPSAWRHLEHSNRVTRHLLLHRRRVALAPRDSVGLSFDRYFFHWHASLDSYSN
jgi:hypothetical protein